MNIKVIPNIELNEYIETCQTELFSGDPIVFKYPKELLGKSIADAIWNELADEIKNLNSTILNSLRNNANIYAIYVFESEEWSVRYVGQRKSKDIRERITQHLIKKDKNTY